MIIRKALAAFCFILCTHLLVFSQSPVTSSTHQGKYIFCIKKKGSELQQSGNRVIRQMSLQLSKPIDKTGYSADYSYVLSSIQCNENFLQFLAHVETVGITGDTRVNGFDTEKILRPQLVSFDVRINNGKGVVIDSASFDDIITGRDTMLRFNYLAHSNTTLQPANIELGNFVFGYSRKGLDEILHYFRSVEIYRASSLLIDSAEKKSEQLNRHVSNPSAEMLQQIFMLSNVVALLERLLPELETLMQNGDPELLLKRIRILDYRIQFIQQHFLNCAGQEGSIQLNRNIYDLADDWVCWQAQRFTDQDLPEFSKLVFYESGIVKYTQGDLVFLKAAISVILKKNSRDALTAGCFYAVVNAVTKAYNRAGERFTSTGHYAEAVDLLNNALNLSDAIPSASCSERLYRQLSIAHYGIYHSYINIAKKALSGNKMQLADKYIRLAKEYQRTNCHYIITDLEIRKLNSQIELEQQSGRE
jgi:hypothetical protein